jgi:CRISPR/Cas system-associated exonuclease Cas4 (RecB family)
MSREIVQGLKFRKPAAFDGAAFSALVEKAYLDSRRESKHTQKVSFSPSSIGYGNGTCPRYWYLAFEGGHFEETTDALGVANMMNGTDAHTRLQKLFEQSGVLVATEVEVKLADPPIRGFIDALIRWEGEIVVGEIKTTRQEAFLFRQTSMKPAPNHLFQILIYMKGTGKSQGFLFYENKNTQEFLVIPVEMNERNEKILEDALEWLRTVRKAWEEDKTLPERPFRKNNKICKNCPVYELCWNQTGPGEVNIPVMEVPR